MGAGVGPAAHQRRMAVHDVLAEIELGGEERLPDPEEIVRQLLGKRAAGAETGMDVMAAVVLRADRQGGEPGDELAGSSATAFRRKAARVRFRRRS